MEVIDISKEQFNGLEKLVLPTGVLNSGLQIYRFNYHGMDMILKKISDFDDLDYSAKLDTLRLLDRYSSYMPYYFVIPKFLVSVNNKIEFLAVPYIDGKNLSEVLRDDNISYTEKKYYLKRVGEILQKMKVIRTSNDNLRNFYLGDLHEDNFIVNFKQRELYVIDLDGAKIFNESSSITKYLSHVTLLNYVNGKYNIDIENAFFTSYKVDENTDLFCYIIVILNFLYGDNVNNMDINEFYKYLNYLRDLKIDKNLLNCFSKIVSNEDNISPMEYIDTLTSEQIMRARKKVYMSS